MTLLDDDVALYINTNTRISSPKTVKHYLICFRQFAEATGATEPKDVNDANVIKFLRAFRDGGASEHTVCQKFDYLRAYATDRAKRGVIPWLMIKGPKRPELVPVALTQDQLRDLFVEAARWGPWWSALVYWFWCTAERTEATLEGARWSNLAGDTIIIPAKYRKGRNKAKAYVLPEDLIAKMDAVRGDDDRVFGWDMSVATFYHRWKRLYTDAGLTYVKFKTGPHQLRRSHASWLEARGGNATDSLGHSARKTTMAYLDPRIVKPTQHSSVLPEIRDVG